MKLADWFVTGKRDNGDSFVTLKEDRPDWLHEAVYAAHGGMFPDDWVYAECEAACEAIDGEWLDEDQLHEYVDGRVDVYTKDRFAWAADKCLTDLYSEAEERAAEMGGDTTDIAERLGTIQYCAIESIAQTILNAATEATEASEDAEESA